MLRPGLLSFLCPRFTGCHTRAWRWNANTFEGRLYWHFHASLLNFVWNDPEGRTLLGHVMKTWYHSLIQSSKQTQGTRRATRTALFLTVRLGIFESRQMFYIRLPCWILNEICQIRFIGILTKLWQKNPGNLCYYSVRKLNVGTFLKRQRPVTSPLVLYASET